MEAASAGRTGTEAPDGIRADVPWLRAVRHAAAPRMGLHLPGPGPVDAVPKVGLVGPPAPYTTTLGEHVAGEDYDVAVRMLTMNAPHPAIGLTTAVAVAAANLADGSVVSTASTARGNDWLRIGTPAGVVPVRCADITPSGPAGSRCNARRASSPRPIFSIPEPSLSLPPPAIRRV